MVLVLGFSAAAGAQTFRLKSEYTEFGSRIKADAVTSKLPFDKTYEQLTDEKRALLRSRYVDMNPSDEPPYPLHGIGPMMREVHKVQDALLERGMVRLVAIVDAQGSVRKVDFYEMTSEKAARAIAFVVTRTPFKPALCDGAPCEMGYPIVLDLKVR